MGKQTDEQVGRQEMGGHTGQSGSPLDSQVAVKLTWKIEPINKLRQANRLAVEWATRLVGKWPGSRWVDREIDR